MTDWLTTGKISRAGCASRTFYKPRHSLRCAARSLRGWRDKDEANGEYSAMQTVLVGG